MTQNNFVIRFYPIWNTSKTAERGVSLINLLQWVTGQDAKQAMERAKSAKSAKSAHQLLLSFPPFHSGHSDQPLATWMTFDADIL